MALKIERILLRVPFKDSKLECYSTNHPFGKSAIRRAGSRSPSQEFLDDQKEDDYVGPKFDFNNFMMT